MKSERKKMKTFTKMMVVLVSTLLLATMSFAQFDGSESSVKSAKVVRKLSIRSADPLLIAMLLSGGQNYFGSPEPTQSSYLFGGGMMGGFGGAGGQGGFGNSMNGNNSGRRGM